MSEVHEFDLEKVFATHPQGQLLSALRQCAASLSCMDESLTERLQVAAKVETAIEEAIHSEVHWIRGSCCEGECDVCNQREDSGGKS